MKISLVYPPFCTPTVPPYSITNLYCFLKNNTNHDLTVLDLNIEYHLKQYPEFHQLCKKGDFSQHKEFLKQSSKDYAHNNKLVLENKQPELFKELLNKIIGKNPDIVSLSIVYSSQVFYAIALLKELRKLNITTIIGGPAVNEKISKFADHTLNNEIELLNFVSKTKVINYDKTLKFDYNFDNYFVPEPVIPLKTTSSCYYKQCAFCTHHKNDPYLEYDLEQIKNSVTTKKVFIIDDMIHKKRLLQLAELFKPLKISWICQLKPTKDLDYQTLKTLKESGLKNIIWGVESGNDEILKKMSKGTSVNDIKTVLENSHKAKIINVLYIMFGFPTETKEQFLDTINFLKENQDNIDLISTSIFGLEKNTKIYQNPSEYKIVKIVETERTFLPKKISYEIKEGLTQEEAKLLRKKYKKTLENINKFPKEMNFFREHLI
jgi:radical SAM superfamily enzyme YgiQ (UPF0313 family)